MKVYTEVVWTWDEEKGELVEESSKSHEYEGPIVGAWPGTPSPFGGKWGGRIRLDPIGITEGWKAGWERGQDKGGMFDDWGAIGKFATGVILGLEGAVKGQLGEHEIYGWDRSPSRSTDTSSGSKLLKTQTAGTGSNFGRYGDISQQAPGGWIRQQNQNRDGRSSTLMTRGLSKKHINARNTA